MDTNWYIQWKTSFPARQRAMYIYIYRERKLRCIPWHGREREHGVKKMTTNVIGIFSSSRLLLFPFSWNLRNLNVYWWEKWGGSGRMGCAVGTHLAPRRPKKRPESPWSAQRVNTDHPAVRDPGPTHQSRNLINSFSSPIRKRSDKIY